MKTGRSCHVDLPAAFQAADIQPLAKSTKTK
jgi:hypothetical protein